MNQKQSLRLIDNAPVLQDVLEGKALLFAQTVMAVARKNKLDNVQVMDDKKSKGGIILL